MFHGIRQLTRDGQGFVYWRGRRVEHYSFSEPGGKEEGDAARALAKRCEHLEQIGVAVDGGTAIWQWARFEHMQAGDPWRAFLCTAGTFYEHRPGCECGEQGKPIHDCQIAPAVPRLAWDIGEGALVWDGEQIAPLALTGESTYHAMRKLGYGLADAGQNAFNGTCYASLEGLKTLFARHGLTPDKVPTLPEPAPAGPDPHRYECACCGAYFDSHKPQSPNRDKGYGHCDECRRRHKGLATDNYA